MPIIWMRITLRLGECSVPTLEEHERRAGVMAVKPQYASDENRVIATFVDRITRTFKYGQCVGERRRSQHGGAKLGRRGVCVRPAWQGAKTRPQWQVPRMPDGVALGLREDLVAIRLSVDAPKNERRIQRDRREGINRNSDRLRFGRRR